MIEHYEFGKFIINGKIYESNVVLLGKEARKGRYLEGHKLKIDDFILLVEYKPEVIVIGTGASGVVKVQAEIREFIEGKGIKLIAEKTAEACKTYNSLVKQGKKVAAFLHNTC